MDHTWPGYSDLVALMEIKTRIKKGSIKNKHTTTAKKHKTYFFVLNSNMADIVYVTTINLSAVFC